MEAQLLSSETHNEEQSNCLLLHRASFQPALSECAGESVPPLNQPWGSCGTTGTRIRPSRLHRCVEPRDFTRRIKSLSDPDDDDDDEQINSDLSGTFESIGSLCRSKRTNRLQVLCESRTVPNALLCLGL